MDTMLKDVVHMKRKLANRQDGYVPTIHEIEENKRQHELCEYYGIRVGVFCDNFTYTKDELLGLRYISAGKEIPEKLAIRLLNTKEQRVGNTKKDICHGTTEKEVEELFGVTLK